MPVQITRCRFTQCLIKFGQDSPACLSSLVQDSSSFHHCFIIKYELVYKPIFSSTDIFAFWDQFGILACCYFRVFYNVCTQMNVHHTEWNLFSVASAYLFPSVHAFLLRNCLHSSPSWAYKMPIVSLSGFILGRAFYLHSHPIPLPYNHLHFHFYSRGFYTCLET